MPRIYTKIDPVVRFWNLVQLRPGEACWTWRAMTDKDGYGKFAPTPGRAATGAHRYAYALAFGPIPDGLYVLHHCDNPSCVRPSHLWLGTALDNARDCVAKGRTNRDARYGDKNRLAKFTNEQAQAIRLRYQQGGVTTRALAALYGVNQTTICAIVRSKRYQPTG